MEDLEFYTMKVGEPLTAEEKAEIAALKGRPIYDWDHSFDEERWKIIGMVDNVLFVIYTERQDKIRIISAREATELERRKYYGRLGILHEESWGTFDGGGES